MSDVEQYINRRKQTDSQLALPALVGKMYSKIHFSRARGWNEPQRHKGHKDRSII
jgi:hypothetical protein